MNINDHDRTAVRKLSALLLEKNTAWLPSKEDIEAALKASEHYDSKEMSLHHWRTLRVASMECIGNRKYAKLMTQILDEREIYNTDDDLVQLLGDAIATQNNDEYSNEYGKALACISALQLAGYKLVKERI